MAHSSLVASRHIKAASLHSPLPFSARLYVWPFGLLYVAYAYAVISHDIDTIFGGSEGRNLALVILGSLNVLALLLTHWSVTLKAWMTCYSVSDPYWAKLIRVIPDKHHGKGELCEIKRQTVLDDETGMPQERLYFFFQQTKYLFNPEKRAFFKLEYPGSRPKPIGYFCESHGIAAEQEWRMAMDRYGPNYFDIPIPTFSALFQQHMVAPFFVFQLFCVTLWFLDDMWYYSLFTLIMLFVFEGTVVMQRLQSLREMRSMSTRPYPIYAHRGGKWGMISSDSLVPGELVSLTRSKDERPVPCDLLLLEGSAIANEAMLSGESTPLLKESVATREKKDPLDERGGGDKLHLAYGGTKILQVTPPPAGSRKSGVPVPPDNGAICYVLRTGFGTAQGKLVRTIVYSSERATANNAEAFVFIVFLLVFAVLAASYVWIEGTKNELRKRSKILLDCVLIITSVVPPELPMELSLAVNNALIALMRRFVFCTEPFRIPFAGKLDVLAFDKTGTLTDTNLVVRGLGMLTGNEKSELIEAKQAGLETSLTLAAAHALVLLEDGVVGDPMEKATLDAIEWNVGKGDTMSPKLEGKAKVKESVRILRRFQFSSSLKRMSAIAAFSDGPGASAGFHYIAAKGAPETIKGMLKSVPEGYDGYKRWAREGSRVLALGFRRLPRLWTAADVKNASRETVESDLDFAGFLVFHCPLKEDSVSAIAKLNASSHRTVMITGDNALTACHVAKQVGIISKPALILDDRDGKIAWEDLDETETIPWESGRTDFDPRLNSFNLCITGAALVRIEDATAFRALLPRIWVYARVSPAQKEFIITSLNKMGYTTLMCGDGTNDVGALKQAHVGVALLEGKREDVIRQSELARHRRSRETQERSKKLASRFGVNVSGGMQATDKAATDVQDGMAKLLDELESEIPIVKFGDASVASPFTSKISSVMSVRDIVLQGRATLVAMLQMYKILALNCIISAYSMSVLYLAGIKQGDWQATIAGLLLTVCFFAIAKSTPLEELSRQRPQPNIFNPYFFLSVLGQSAIHIAALAYVRTEAIQYSEVLDEEINLDAEFSPNILNTAVYLISLSMQIATFAINYQGRPFRESLTENKPLWLAIRIVGSILVTSALQVFPFINGWMELVDMPVLFQRKLLTAMVLDVALAWLVEDTMKTLLSDSRPKAGLLIDSS